MITIRQLWRMWRLHSLLQAYRRANAESERCGVALERHIEKIIGDRRTRYAERRRIVRAKQDADRRQTLANAG